VAKVGKPMSERDGEVGDGWNAISRALEGLYPGQEPSHFGTLIPYHLGGRDPIHGISVYRNDGQQPHWHYITYGYTELWDKESDNPDVSGFGLEMTFRLTRGAGELQPPTWPLSFLQNLARYVFDTGNVFKARHQVPLNGPICLGSETQIHAASFVLDPQLPALDTPNGRFEFLQVVGLTLEERDALQNWDGERFFAVLGRINPLYLTDLERQSILADAAVAEEVRAGRRRDGSSTDGVYVRVLGWATEPAPPGVQLILGASAVPDQMMLRGRLPYGRDFSLWGNGRTVRFETAACPGWEEDGKRLIVRIPTALLEAVLAGLEPRRGLYRWPEFPAFRIEIQPSEIRDGQGNIERVVG
jgi:suppressor of fused